MKRMLARLLGRSSPAPVHAGHRLVPRYEPDPAAEGAYHDAALDRLEHGGYESLPLSEIGIRVEPWGKYCTWPRERTDDQVIAECRAVAIDDEAITAATAVEADAIAPTASAGSAESQSNNAARTTPSSATAPVSKRRSPPRRAKKVQPWDELGISRQHYWKRRKEQRLIDAIETEKAGKQTAETALADCQADRQRLATELATARAELDAVKAAPPTVDANAVPLDAPRLMALLGLCGVHNADALRSLLDMPADEFAARMRAELERRQAQFEVLRCAQLQQARPANV
jgi:hypothetical protein